MIKYEKFNDVTGVGIDITTDKSGDHLLFDTIEERDKVFDILNNMLSSKYKKIEFNVLTKAGSVKTTGYIKGNTDIVIHKELTYNKYWTISDYRSGLNISNGSPTLKRDDWLLYIPKIFKWYYKAENQAAIKKCNCIN